MLEDVVRKGRLLDVYGPLLTDRQRRCMEMYFDMDLSLSEIGEELEISRQGVHDMLHRASKALEQYEEKLHLLQRSDAAQESIDRAIALLEEGEDGSVPRAVQALRDISL